MEDRFQPQALKKRNRAKKKCLNQYYTFIDRQERQNADLTVENVENDKNSQYSQYSPEIHNLLAELPDNSIYLPQQAMYLIRAGQKNLHLPWELHYYFDFCDIKIEDEDYQYCLIHVTKCDAKLCIKLSTSCFIDLENIVVSSVFVQCSFCKYLKLAFCGFYNITFIGQYIQLAALILENHKLTSITLDAAQFPKLLNLSLSNSPIEKLSLNLPLLQKLDISCTSLVFFDATALSELQSLKMNNSTIQFVNLSANKRLKCLKARESQIQYINIDNTQKYDELDFCGTQLYFINIGLFCKNDVYIGKANVKTQEYYMKEKFGWRQ